jgi:hypothetical protein
MKKIFSIIGIIILIACGIFVYKLATFKLFDNKLIFLEQVPIPEKGYSLMIYNFPSNATIQGSIQVHLKYTNREEKLLKNYDRYNRVVSAIPEGDSLLKLELIDTISYQSNVDTFNLRLP